MDMQPVDPRIVAKYVTQYMAQQENFMKYQLDSSDELKDLYNDLLGLEYIPEQNKFVKVPYKEQLISQKGANTILVFLRPRISKITSLSNLDDEDIRKRCHNYMDALTYMLVRHMDEYKVKSLQVVKNIIELCDDVFYVTMMKAYEAGERDTLRKQFTHVESDERVTRNESSGNKFFADPLRTIVRR